ncbi:MAG: PepSY-associated TM helix domain-containing protein [Acidobacteriota bacterium]|nr:PepSY-associated TM helix domain-containing protein [Acidobacteriota bacterium]
MMYKWLRNLHLIVGLFALPMILTYAVSSVQMAHRIRIPQSVTEETLALSAGLAPRAAAQQLMDQRGFSGDFGNAATTPSAVTFAITRVGTRYQVTYNPANGNTHVRTIDTGVWGELNRLHHLNGFGHQNSAMNIWSWLLAVVSVILLTIGATGIYMWFKLHRERAVGIVLLSANLAISLLLLIILRS